MAFSSDCWHAPYMERTALPLLLASDRFASDDASEPMDGLRMQKGVFLLTQNGSDEWNELFPFGPYDWGPYSRVLASDLRSLTTLGLLSDDLSPDNRYGAYRTTTKGENEIRDLHLGEKQTTFIQAVSSFVTSRPFSHLLKDIYAAFPTYATESKFKPVQ